jgi:hypothetical protein
VSGESGKHFDLSRLSRTDLHQRPSKVTLSHFGKPVRAGMTVAEMLDAFPDILAAGDLKRIASAIVAARKAGRQVHISMGAHVLKVGLSPMLIDLMERSVITGLSFNGAVLVHDYEIAAAGKTSEDVDQALGAGAFGMARQTGEDFARFVSEGDAAELGLGQAVANGIEQGDFPNKAYSLLASAQRLGIPVTAHPALGTDITHLGANLDWGALGRCAQRDFLRFTALVEKMAGAVYLNVGSAVVLPEVFLKAVTATRNAGADHSGLTTADFDFIRGYRPMTNVVRRPTENLGKGYAITGHHEIVLPLLFTVVSEMMASE